MNDVVEMINDIVKWFANFANKNVKSIVTLITVAIIINFLTPISTSISNLLDRLAPSATVDVVSEQAIISSLRGIGKLVTVTSDPHARKVFVSISEGIFDSGYYSANHEVAGIVEAGVDFTKVKSSSLRYDTANDAYILIIPAPELTNCIIVKLKQTEHSLHLGLRDWELLEELARHEAIGLFMSDVKEIGILDKAEEETELLLGEFVRNLIDKPVDVIFEEQKSETDLPDTCAPKLPFGWEKDESGAWRRAS